MLLDTDFVIDLLRDKPDAKHLLKELAESTNALFLSHVSLWELYQGVYKSNEIEKNLVTIDELVDYFEILPFTKDVDKRFGRLKGYLEKRGEAIGVMDTLIASIALEYNLTVVTKNKKHFERTGVKVRSW